MATETYSKQEVDTMIDNLEKVVRDYGDKVDKYAANTQEKFDYIVEMLYASGFRYPDKDKP